VDDEVAAIVHQQGRFKISRMPVESVMAHTWAFRDGKEARMECSDPSAALNAVGLEAWAVSA
jgi:hypothetical protein